jgi:hypothetical protein
MTAAILVVLTIAGFVAGWLVARTGLGSRVSPATLDERERAFAERMRNVALVGSFTTEGDAAPAPSAERYGIVSAEKVGDDLWRFTADLDCCGIHGRMPIVVPLRWAGDTPMIAMTETTLPGLGTFTVRLFFHADRYAGTWQHGERRGQMQGRIEQQAAVVVA